MLYPVKSLVRPPGERTGGSPFGRLICNHGHTKRLGPRSNLTRPRTSSRACPNLGVARAADRLLARSGGSPADPNVVDSYPSAIPDARVGVAHIELDEPSDVRSAASSPPCFIASSANAKASDVSGLR